MDSIKIYFKFSTYSNNSLKIDLINLTTNQKIEELTTECKFDKTFFENQLKNYIENYNIKNESDQIFIKSLKKYNINTNKFISINPNSKYAKFIFEKILQCNKILYIKNETLLNYLYLDNLNINNNIYNSNILYNLLNNIKNNTYTLLLNNITNNIIDII